MDEKELKQAYANMRMKVDLSLSMLTANASMKVKEMLEGKSQEYINGFNDGIKMWNEMSIEHNKTQHQGIAEFMEALNKGGE